MRKRTLASIFAAVAFVSFACGGGEGGGETEAAEMAPAPEAAAPTIAAEDLPEGVTTAMVAEGAGLYAGSAVCLTCHGPNGAGVTGLGPSLADAEWLHSDGSFENIVTQIANGVLASESTTGVMMPPKGGSGITDEQVRSVAAYVWSLRLSN
jgi:mono/diheme cytochrome c family protein